MLDGPPIAAGSYDVTVTAGAGFDVTVTRTLVVEPRDLGVTNVQWADRTYDGTTDAIATDAGLDPSNLVDGDDVALTTPLVGAFAASDVGDHAVSASFELEGDDASNYALVAPAAGSATITARQLTLADATVETRIYDATDVATVNGTLQGVVNGDDVAAEGSFEDVDAGTDVPVSTTLTGPDAGNYVLSRLQAWSGRSSPRR
ncbi:MAG: YDG domain-containing protein [Trueperaceae bacterium]|nr:YDG domain-containing protein [Trueperaceae bacterium]